MDKIETSTFKRSEAHSLLKELKSGHSFLLLGARQTGKSTLLEGLFEELPPDRIRKVYLQLPSKQTALEADPEILLREIEGMQSSKPVYVFIDEIQKIPKIMDVLQFLIDHKKIILAASGSSARKLKTLGTNWLPGRIRLNHLFPLTWQETGFNHQDLPLILRFGTLPGILSEADLGHREASLTAYTHLYLDEEIRMEATVRNVPRFARFLQIAALESGSAPNLSKIGSLVEMSHTSIREYFQILEDSLIIHRLAAFGSNRDNVLRTAKYYFFDLGVRNAAALIGHSPGILTLQQGVLFEHFIILELIAHFKGTKQLSYWRTKEGQEVDIIIEMEGQRVAVEIKSTNKPVADDFRGLAAFCKKYKCKKAYLACQVSHPQKFEAGLAIPWWELTERLK